MAVSNPHAKYAEHTSDATPCGKVFDCKRLAGGVSFFSRIYHKGCCSPHNGRQRVAAYQVIMSVLLRIVDSPLSWAIAGFGIGVGLGVNAVSVWLLTAGLVAFLAYLVMHGEAKQETEGWLLAAAPAFILAWIAGFIVKGLAF